MAQSDALKRYLDAGLAFTRMSRERAEAIVRDLVQTGDVGRDKADDRIEDLIERSRANAEELVGVIRREVAQQLRVLGLEDLARRADPTAGDKPATPGDPAPTDASPAPPDDAPTQARAAAKKAAVRKVAEDSPARARRTAAQAPAEAGTKEPASPGARGARAKPAPGPPADEAPPGGAAKRAAAKKAAVKKAAAKKAVRAEPGRDGGRSAPGAAADKP